MMTRRGFFGTVAALVVGGGAAQLRLTPEPEPIEWKNRLYTIPAPTGGYYVFSQNTVWHVAPRRDDGDTLLELR